MDIVLGVSLTPKTVRMVLVEGEKGDGSIVDHDTFEVQPADDTAISSAADQVVAAVLGTQESAVEGGHVLKSIGVTWSDRAEAAQLRDALTARGIRDVILVSELHAAGALAQAAGRAVGYTSTALLFIDRDSATLSVVHGDDGSIVKVLSTNLHSSDAMAVLGEMAAAVEAQPTPPQGMFVVGSGVDIGAVKQHLQSIVSLPVNAPEESGLALARGAAIAAANSPIYDATTAGLAYSQDPDGPTAGNEYVGLANAATELRPADAYSDDYYLDEPAPVVAEEGHKPFLLVGSALTSIFVIGVVALVISLAVSIRPTADQRPQAVPPLIPAAPPAEVVPNLPEANVPAPAPVPKPEPAPAPAPETIKAPIPVVQEAPAPQAPPRQVYVEPPAAPAPAPAAPAPAPAAPVIPAPLPVAPAPVPAYVPPVIFPPIWQQPQWQPPRQQPPWQQPPWQQWPQQGHGDDDWPQGPQWPQQPPPPPQQPDYPQWPGRGDGGGQPGTQWPGGGGGGRGDGDGGGRGGGGGGHGGYGGGGGGGGGGQNCFLIFCS